MGEILFEIDNQNRVIHKVIFYKDSGILEVVRDDGLIRFSIDLEELIIDMLDKMDSRGTKDIVGTIRGTESINFLFPRK